MYCSHFGLHRLAFNNTPDPAFYYSTPDHEEALATLQYATQQRKGFVLLTGEVGAGKTLIGRMFLRRVESRAQTAVITHTHLSGNQLLSAICAEFELDPPPEANNLELAHLLQSYLLDQFAQDRFVAVVLDEAQNLPDESFEELRMLGNLEADDAKLLQVCILGQPELRNRFAQPNMKQLEQRLFRRFHLPALTQERTGEYIRHRLKVAGCTNDQLFGPGTTDKIFAASNGIPRLINQVCDNALLAAYAQDAHTVDAQIIDEVLDRDTSPEASAEAETPVAAQAPPGTESPHQTTDRQIEQTRGPAPSSTSPAANESPVGPADSAQPTEVTSEQTQDAPKRAEASSHSAASVEKDLEKVAQRQAELRTVVSRARRRWLTTKERLEAHRKDIQAVIDDVTSRCQSTQKQLEELARTAAPAKDLEEIRTRHLSEARRVLDEVARQRAEFQQLVELAETRWAQIHKRMTDLSVTAVTKDALVNLDSQYDRRIQDVLGRLEKHRERVAEITDAVRQRYDQTQNNLSKLRESYAQTHAELIDRVDTQLAETRRGVNQQLHGKAGHEELESLRESNEQAHAEIAGDVGARLAEARQEIDQQLEGKADREAFELLSDSSARARIQMIERMDAELEKTRQELRQRMGETARAEDLAALRNRQSETIDKLGAQLSQREHEINLLGQQVASKLDAIKGVLEELEGKSATAEELQRVRAEQAEAISDIVRRFTNETNALKEFHQAVTRQSRSASEEQESQLKELAGRVINQAQQLQDLRQKLLTHHAGMQKRIDELSEQFAARSEVEELRQAQTRQNADLLGRIEMNHEAMQELIEGVVERYRSTQARLDAVVSSKVDEEELARFRAKQEEEGSQLLQLLDEQRREMHEQFEQTASCWVQTQENLEEISANAAEAKLVEEVRQQQARDSEQILATIASQRRDLESLVDGIDNRCERLVQRMNELPADIATTDDLKAIQSEHAEQIHRFAQEIRSRKAQFEQTVKRFAGRFDQTQKAVEALAARAASVEDIEGLREQHSETVSGIMERIDHERDQQQEKVADLKRRCEMLNKNVKTLAATATPADTFKKAEQSFSRNVASLGERINDVTSRHTGHLHTVIDALQHATERVTALEQAERPRPVKIELNPQVAAMLADLVTSARAERQQLRQELDQAAEIASSLRELSSQTQETMRYWKDSAEEVRTQSDQLRTSAKMAADILAVMRRCHEALDAKLNSEQWQLELARSQDLATRLEQATLAAHAACEQVGLGARAACEQVAHATRAASQQASHRMKKLIAESEAVTDSFSQAVEKRRKLLTALAKNTAGLTEVIESARHFDEEQHPSLSTVATEKAEAEERHISQIDWPRFRTRQAQAS